MQYVICYDVVEDDIRLKISYICKEYGLSRIQYSIFNGKLNNTQRKEIERKFEDIIAGSNTSIFIIPQCSTCLGKTVELSSSTPVKKEIKKKKKKLSIIEFEEVESGVIVL